MTSQNQACAGRATTRQCRNRHPLYERVRTAGRRPVVAGLEAVGRVRDGLERDQPGGGLLFGGRDSNLEPAGDAIELPGAQRCPAVFIGRHHVRAESIGEHASRPIVGQVEADGRSRDGAAGFVGDLHAQWPGAPRAGSMHAPFAFDDLNMKNRDLSCRRAGQRQNQRRCGPLELQFTTGGVDEGNLS